MNPEHSGVPLRRRVLVSILAVTALAVILFALPLGVAVQRLYRTEAVTALQRDAARAACRASLRRTRSSACTTRQAAAWRARARPVRPLPRAAPGPRSATRSR